MAKTLRLLADYDCDPLWDPDAADYVSPSELPLSSELVSRLDRWQAQYDSLLNLADPYAMGFRTREEADAFEKEGLELARRVQKELGANYAIFYRDEPVQVPTVV